MVNGKCKISSDKCSGFTLIEVLVALALMGLFASITVVAINKVDDKVKYDETQKTMLEIKEAILGKPDLYCNGWKQFTGYVSDMGAVPTLVDDQGNEVEKGGQPRALWTRDINNDDDTEDQGIDIAESFLWKHYKDTKIWAGWRGPYIRPPGDNVLRDGWGNPFMFVTGEVVTLKDVAGGGSLRSGTYRCIKNYAGIRNSGLPGFVSGRGVNWDECWESFPEGPILDPPESYKSSNSDKEETFKYNIFYGKENALTICSYGADGKPGGTGLNQDIVLTVYRTDWTGEVAGHVGYSGNRYVDEVIINYPEYKKGEDSIIKSSEPIQITNNDSGHGINFRFGAAPEVGDKCRPACNYDDYENFQKISIPMGIRSIKITKEGSDDKICVFTVEPTGNWLGTIH